MQFDTLDINLHDHDRVGNKSATSRELFALNWIRVIYIR